jgi:hypothetical protein
MIDSKLDERVPSTVLRRSKPALRKGRRTQLDRDAGPADELTDDGVQRPAGRRPDKRFLDDPWPYSRGLLAAVTEVFIARRWWRRILRPRP